MADSVRGVLLLVTISALFSSCQATTHWVVTEDGMITQQLDSVFNLREPYNLIAVLGQEKRSKEVNLLEESLRLQKVSIEANEDKDTDLEQRFLETDGDCVAAGRPLSEFELYISTALSLEQKDINPLDHMKMKIGEVKKFRQPNCSRVLELTYSIHAFDHLKAIQERHNISSFPEPELMYLLPSVGSLENAGHMIYKAMSKNKTSWVLFNLAAYYWRVKGRPEQVIECSRRALHFSPHEHKNVALMNMANVLHRGHLSADASVLAEAALEGDQELDIVYFTLGNIYAAIGEYNKSSWCFGHTSRINSALGAAEKRQHAVKCHQKLERALEAQHSSLQRTLSELKDYQTKQEYFLELQKKMLSIQRKAEEQYEANLSYQKHRFLQEMGENPRCEVSQLGSGTQFLMCRRDGIPETDVYGQPFDDEKEIEVLDESRFQNNCVVFPDGDKNCLNLSGTGGPPEQKLYMASQDTAPHGTAPQGSAPHGSASQGTAPHVSASHESAPRGTVPHETVQRDSVSLTHLPDKIEQPSDSECARWKGINVSWKEFAQRLVPMGLNESLEALKKNVGMPADYPHSNAPSCSHRAPLFNGNTGVDFIEGIANREFLPNVGCPIKLMMVFRKYLDAQNLMGREFDYRVTYAMSTRTDYKDIWLIYSAAAIYWRVHPDDGKSIECLRRALFYAPVDRVDVPLTNMAMAMVDQERYEDAIQILRMALVVDSMKPTTRYLLGCLYAALGQYRQARQESSLAYNLDPESSDAFEVYSRIRCLLKAGEKDKPNPMNEAKTGQGILGKSGLSGAVPACVQGPPQGEQTGQRQPSGGPPGASTNPLNNQVDFKSCNAGSVPSTAFGPQIPAAPAPDVDVNKLFAKRDSHWPTLEECAGYRKLNLKAFYSTWISITAKDMRLDDFIDFHTQLTREELQIQPYCDAKLPASMHTLDHIPAMALRGTLTYEAEQGLKEVIQSINGGYMDHDEVGTRVAKLLEKDPESWVATNMAALYWRIEGKSLNALHCLRHALHYSPSNMKDLAMVSIANIFHRVGMYEDAATVAKMAIDISPQLVINHFTLANIYSSKGQWDHALDFYQSTLRLQPDFQPAVERLRTIQCNVLQLTANKNPA
ncbi:tetratricopeptide repeat protein 17-like [Lytechinus variegatus]|uniref:tetratricopeptide repeat protein 17-like n=1 Tax=Lytechinus variegatus TaxID=7654 RepID=UPI001BB256B3|nr:tetratricopeptide repeat protein 17-like [Lytechinus variegatus]